MSKVSVVLATYNEEQNIGDCLKSVARLADEIVIVDGTSTDKTVEIARRFTDKITIRENPLMFHLNKQLAIEKATGDWILYLDADERVSPELAKEVKYVIRDTKYDGFWVPRKNIIFGKWIKNDFWWPDNQLRLFRRGKAYLPCKSVHEQPTLEGKAGYLTNPLVHQNYQHVSQYLDKINRLYSENDLRQITGKDFYWPDLIQKPVDDYLATLFSRKGYRDGLHGLVLAILQAFSTFTTMAKYWEQSKFPPIEEKEIMAKFPGQWQEITRKIDYWILDYRTKNTKSLVKKLIYRIQRKCLPIISVRK